MSVDPAWLAETRKKNRQEFGMAGMGGSGMGGLGAGAEDLAHTLHSARAARTAQGLSSRERAAAIQAQQSLASDPRSAALLALPSVQIPQAQPIPKTLLVVGGLVAFGLLGLIIWRSR